MMYQFDSEIAKTYGVDEAIMLSNIIYWVRKNKSNNTKFYDDKTWTYNSVKAYEILFPFWSTAQLRRVLKSLEDNDLIVSGNYNGSAYDRTKWYALKNEEDFIDLSAFSTCDSQQIDLLESANEIVDTSKPIPNSKPNSKPNKKTYNNSSANSQAVHQCYKNCLKFFDSHLHPKNESQKNKWVDTVRLLNEREELPFEVIEKIVEYTRKDDFWKPNFLSLAKLRKKNKEDVMYVTVFYEQIKSKYNGSKQRTAGIGLKIQEHFNV